VTWRCKSRPPPDSGFTDSRHRQGVSNEVRTAFRAVELAAVVVEHRRDVHGGTVCASAAGSPYRGQEPADGSTGVRSGAQDGAEDAGVFGAAGVSAAAAGAAAQAGTVAGRDTNGERPYWPESALKDHIRPAAIKAGIKDKVIGWHTFRHSVGTLLGQKGEDVKTVQELLRHANSRITLDVYQQGNTAKKRNALSGMSGIFVAPPLKRAG